MQRFEAYFLGLSVLVSASGCSITEQPSSFDVASQPASAPQRNAEVCAHLAGEFAGDRSERDQEITRQLIALECDKLTAP